MFYATALKNTRMTDVVTAIGTSGVLKIYTTGLGTLLSTIPLAAVAGTVTGGVLTFSSMPRTDTSAAASGTAAAAQVFQSDGTTLVIGGLTVSSSAGDIVLSSTNIVAGQPVTITAASITHP
jgi:hypothetical protein